MAVSVCVFDAYGTLFDVAAAARDLAERGQFSTIRDSWRDLAQDWRLKQLHYTWWRAITGRHTDFWQVTCDSLDWALAARGLADPALRQALLDLYHRLAPYPEAPAALQALKSSGYRTAILSNGAPSMLTGAVEAARMGPLLDAVLSVEDVGVFKPARQVYDMVGDRFDVPADQVLFVSSNGWDVAAAADYGFQTVWVNRLSEPVDHLPGRPDHQLPDLTDIPRLAGSM